MYWYIFVYNICYTFCFGILVNSKCYVLKVNLLMAHIHSMHKLSVSSIYTDNGSLSFISQDCSVKQYTMYNTIYACSNSAM